jgi:hypothetical protein
MAKECFFCGELKVDDQSDPDVMLTVVTMDGRVGVWPCHERCVNASKHPDAQDLSRSKDLGEQHFSVTYRTEVSSD